MADAKTLAEVIDAAIHSWLADNGGGFPIAYVMSLDYVNSEGKSMLFIGDMDDQPTHRSLGLVAYADAWFRDDALMTWQAAFPDADD